MTTIEFDDKTKKMFQKVFDSFGEKDSRRVSGLFFACLKVRISVICQLFGVSEKTVRKGWHEIHKEILSCPNRQRVKGGGRKAKWSDPELNAVFIEAIEPYTAGDPMKPKVKWTNLYCSEIADLLAFRGFKISINTVRKLLKHNDFKKRKIQKRKSLKQVVDRDAQFNVINKARLDFEKSGDPVISIDTKKKEKIGENSRDGKSYANGQVDGPDHTFGGLDIGTAVPHGIYDIANNHACIHIGKSAETAKFLVDSILLWWINEGIKKYPKATRILMLFDAGGANSYRHHLFKSELQRLANGMGIDILIKHYPSYASKWNPIEHRVFCHVARAIHGVFIRTFDEFKNLVARTKTKKGLSVTVRFIEGTYQTGERGQKEDWDGSIKFDDILPKWNYGCVPAF